MGVSTKRKGHMSIDKKELLAKAELGTYLEGLTDARDMTRKELEKAIDLIVNAPTEIL